MNDVSIVICGEAGQGIQTVEYVLTRILKLSGYNVFATKEYMSRIRGGTNSTEIRVASKRVSTLLDRIDLLVPLNKGAIMHLKRRITPDTLILGEKESITEDERRIINRFIEIPLRKIAVDIGNVVYSNLVAVGVLSGLFRVESSIIEDYVREYFSEKGEDIIGKNIEAERRGYEIGQNLIETGKVEIDPEKSRKATEEIFINGTEAVALGAIAGGCNFLSFYPMTPSTGVATFLAHHAKDFGIIVEQGEDEIAVVNMAIGAWYAGARGMVTTSGGGFALMVEGFSLSGMFESPLVVHIGQRPGPATGLATRTEQADLLFCLFSGHGEFPRVIYAPGTMEDAFYLTAKAFDVAAKYQIPAIILTDQHFVDSSYNIPSLDLKSAKLDKHFVRTDKKYRRYQLTEDGVSPRGIPGWGDGLVSACSDEHDEEGHITEDRELRRKMVEKRLKKMDVIKNEVVQPELIGNKNYHTLILGWGATRNVVKEALEELGRAEISFLHFKQVYPLHPDTEKYVQNAKRAIIIENNATAQFGQLIKLQAGIDVDRKILKYDGRPFSKEEVVEKLKKEMEV